jgi:hypothetical protein
MSGPKVSFLASHIKRDGGFSGARRPPSWGQILGALRKSGPARCSSREWSALEKRGEPQASASTEFICRTTAAASSIASLPRWTCFRRSARPSAIRSRSSSTQVFGMEQTSRPRSHSERTQAPSAAHTYMVNGRRRSRSAACIQLLTDQFTRTMQLSRRPGRRVVHQSRDASMSAPAPSPPCRAVASSTNSDRRPDDQRPRRLGQRNPVPIRSRTGQWSICGAERAQPGAIRGKSANRESGSATCEQPPLVASLRHRAEMVRRGSTLRVR